MIFSIIDYSEIFFSISVISGIILLIFNQKNKNIIGLKDWILANLVAGIGIFFIFTLRNELTGFFSILVGNFFFILSYILCYTGLQKFNRKKIEKKFIFYPISIFLIFFLISYSHTSLTSLRIIANSLLLLFFSTLILHNLYKNHLLIETGKKIFAISFFITSSTAVIRIIDNIFNLNRQNIAENVIISDVIYLSWGSVACLFYLAGIIIMIQEKRERKFKDTIENYFNFNNAIKENLINQKKNLNLLSYEYLTPLSSLNASNSLLKKEIINENTAEELNRIDRSIKKLINVTNETLNNQSLIVSFKNINREKIIIVNSLTKIKNNFQINYENKLDERNFIYGEEIFFIFLISKFISSALKNCNDRYSVKLSSQIVENHIEIQIVYDGSIDDIDLIKEISEEKLIYKDTNNNSFELNLVIEVIKKLNITINLKKENNLNILILKLKKMTSNER